MTKANGSGLVDDGDSWQDWVRLTSRPASPAKSTNCVKLVDLFCGCGGLTLGVWEACRRSRRRLQIRLAVDFAEEPLKVYRRNFDPIGKFIQQKGVQGILDGPCGAPPTPSETAWLKAVGEVDLIVAGPPCQGHSDLNNSTRRSDPRNQLYLRAVRAVELMRPRALLIENVPAVIHDRDRVIESATELLAAAGYAVREQLVELTQLGLPQRRKRHLLIGALGRDINISGWLSAAHVRKTATVGDFISGLEQEPDRREGAFYAAPGVTADNSRRIRYLFQHNLYDLPNRLRPACHRDKPHSYRSMYGRLRSDHPAQTITSGFGSMGQGRYVHPTQRRTLTAHEAARLQGFPDFFDFSDAGGVTALREMIGNAVPPQLAAIVVMNMLREQVI